MGLLGKSYDPYGGMTSLLGVDMNAMRKQALWEGLANAGFTLMGNKNLGAAGGAFLQGTNAARDNYMQTALDAYRLKQDAEDRQLRKDRYALEDERWEKDFGLRQTEVAQKNTQFDWQMEDRQRADDLRTGQKTAVQGFAQDFKQQGGDLFDPGMQTWLRGQGIAGVDPADTQRYNKMKPYMAAQDYGGAFQQMTAQAGKKDLMTVGKDSSIYDPNQGKWITPPQQEGGARNFDDEAKLRGEYMKETQPFADLRTNYQRIVAATQDQTGASDIALVFSYMKMLDPTSAVREGEYATAESAGGVPAKIVSLYNQALTGERLSPQVRADFQQQAGKQYAQQMQTYALIRKKYEGLAKDYRFDPSRIAPDLSYGVELLPDQQVTANIPQEAISELLADPSPQAVQEFDAAFGQGAAAAVLNRR